MARVLITGARGFIGRPTLALLRHLGHEVHAVTSQNRVPAPPKDASEPDASWHVVDLRDAAQCRALIDAVQPDQLLHLAWITEHGNYWEAAENHQWVSGGLALIGEFFARGGQRCVGAGTCAEYDWQQSGPYREDQTGTPPATLYGLCKRQLQERATEIADRAGGSFAWGRIFSPYGPGEAPQRFVPSIIGSLLQRRPARMSSGRHDRDMIYVDDVARALVALLISPVAGPVNIATGEGVKLADVARQIAERLEAADLLEVGALPDRAGEPAQLVADVTRLRDEVGFAPSHSLDSGLALTTDWWSAAGRISR